MRAELLGSASVGRLLRVERLLPPLTVLGLTGLVGWLAAVDPTSPWRAAVTVAFFVVAPGLAVVPLLGLRDGFARYALIVAVSLSADMLAAEALLYAGAWSPRLSMTALAAFSVAGALAQVALATRRVTAPVALPVTTPPAEPLLARAAGFLVCPIDEARLQAVLATVDAVPPGPVLVVERDPAIRKQLRQLLRAQRWAIADADDSRGALQLVASMRPSLILYDYALYLEDDVDFFANLQADPDWSTIPVVVTSSARLAFLTASAKTANERRVPERVALRRRLLDTSRVRLSKLVATRGGNV